MGAIPGEEKGFCMSNTSICASTTLLERKLGVVLVLQYIVWDNLQLGRICVRYAE